jgi:pyruvate,water dikinase
MSSWLAQHFAVGFSAGLAGFSVPLSVFTARWNTYFYMSQMPNVPPEQMAEMEGKAASLVQAGVASFWQRWESEWLPELKRTWAEWAETDLRALTDGELLALVDRALRVYERIWTIHFTALPPGMIAMSAFQDLYADLFPERPSFDAYRLVSGVENISLEAGRKLWALSRAARANAEVRAVIESTPSEGVMAALDSSTAGREFLGQLWEFLNGYGKRSDSVQELNVPSWIEQPQPAIDSLKAYIRQDEDPDIAHRELLEERERLVAETRSAIKGYPEAVRGQFEFLLAAAQHGARLQEDHNFWIDQRGLHEMRQLCREFGRRLAERRQLADADDVFMLSMDEAMERLVDGASGAALAASRRAEMEQWAKVRPPELVGTDYGPPPDNPITRALLKFFGTPERPGAPAQTRVQGNAGSPGKVTGTARVILNLQDAGRLNRGDILVTPTTSPPWTPFFATVGGIVTETGGALSHCAIVAREYGIPAVVGAANATTAIPEGATIEIDGDTGSVRVVS